MGDRPSAAIIPLVVEPLAPSAGAPATLGGVQGDLWAGRKRKLWEKKRTRLAETRSIKSSAGPGGAAHRQAGPPAGTTRY